MPVMVVGADTAAGREIIGQVNAPEREVRAFVSDPSQGSCLKEQGVKVALGDLSDISHLAAACLRCHTVVLVCDAACDGREISFASDPQEVFTGWAQAVTEARVRRVIWVSDQPVPQAAVPEQATVDSTLPLPELAELVTELDDAVSL